ncbi:MAG TPA: hypothetical protein VNA28_08600 [Solirubrobacteraceae bacterium]|nr:hypothetical protein [Solirubrobacteraceae bacterium]
MTIQASVGTPGRSFAAAQTISPPSPHTSQPGVVMDGAGNAVVVWEDVVCIAAGYRGNCDGYASLGVFASVRPARGTFRAPLRLSPVQSGKAAPLLAMNRNGDWVVVMRQGAETVLATASGAVSPIAWSVLGKPRLVVHAVALDGLGNATLAGATSDQQPATVVRGADGMIGDVAVLDNAQIHVGGLTLGVGRQGHAVAMWAAGGYLRSATRHPRGGFGLAVSSGVPADHAPGQIGVDDRGRTRTLLSPTPTFPGRFVLQVARGTVDAPFGELVTVSNPRRDAPAPTAFAFSASGDAVLLWRESDRGRDPSVHVALAADGGPFSAPRPLATAAGETLQSTDLAMDGAGRIVLAWTSLSADRQRIVVAALSPAAGIAAGPTVVAQIRVPDPQPRASAGRGQVLRIRSNGTIRPLLRCVSPNMSCRGTVRIDAPAAAGRRVRAGTARFVHKAGSSRRVTIRLNRATRRAARRRTLVCTVTVRTPKIGGGFVSVTTALTLRGYRR